jgi:hypothetical protein
MANPEKEKETAYTLFRDYLAADERRVRCDKAADEALRQRTEAEGRIRELRNRLAFLVPRPGDERILSLSSDRKALLLRNDEGYGGIDATVLDLESPFGIDLPDTGPVVDMTEPDDDPSVSDAVFYQGIPADVAAACQCDESCGACERNDEPGEDLDAKIRRMHGCGWLSADIIGHLDISHERLAEVVGKAVTA